MTKSVGRDKIGSITPGSDRKLADGFTEYSVQLKLANVNLAQLVDALYGINSLTMPIGVSTIRIQRRTQDTHSYDVDLTCVALADIRTCHRNIVAYRTPLTPPRPFALGGFRSAA